MAEPAQKLKTLTYAEAKALEDASDERHIFWDGVLYATAGFSSADLVFDVELAPLPVNP
jgi:hypothetical protein